MINIVFTPISNEDKRLRDDASSDTESFASALKAAQGGAPGMGLPQTPLKQGDAEDGSPYAQTTGARSSTSRLVPGEPATREERMANLRDIFAVGSRLHPTAAGVSGEGDEAVGGAPSATSTSALPTREERMANLREVFAAGSRLNTTTAGVSGTGDEAAGGASSVPTFASPAPPTREERMADLSEIFATNLGRDRGALSVQDAMTDAQEGTYARQTAGANAALEVPVVSRENAFANIAAAIQRELAKARGERPVIELLKNDLEITRAERPVGDMMLENLIAAKKELRLSAEDEQKFLTAVAGSDTIDPEKKKELIDGANQEMQSKWDAEVVQVFAQKIGKELAPDWADDIA